MRYVLFAAVALALACLQHTRLAALPWAPDLPLALAAWGMVDGRDRGVVARAWLAGFMVDLADPGSESFHLIGYTALALASLPVRSLVFRARFAAWALWGTVSSLLLAMADRLLAGAGDATWTTILATAAATGVAAGTVGWLMRGLPDPIRPVAPAEA